MSFNQTDGMLIAETSESGEVTWVWVLRNGERHPRPLRQHDTGLSLERFHISGATRDAITSWLGTATA